MEDEGFDEDEIKIFRSLKLSSWTQIPDSVQKVWQQYHGRVPQLHDARRCWVFEPPTDSDLFVAAMDQIQNSDTDPSEACSVVHRSELDGKISPKRALAQLHVPDRWNPIKLLGLRLPLQDGILKLPQDLGLDVTPADNLQFMLTPKYSTTGLHLGALSQLYFLRSLYLFYFSSALSSYVLMIIDNGNGFSIIAGTKGIKIISVFPNSKLNLKLVKSTKGRDTKLQEIGHELEAGITYTIDSSVGIDLEFSLHAAWTLEGCFLATMDFLRPASVNTYAAVLSAKLDIYFREDHRRDLFDRFLNSLELATEDSGYAYDSLRSWIAVLDRVREWAEMNPVWKKEAENLYTKLMLPREDCPCGGKSPLEDFQQHFRDYHLLPASHDRQIAGPKKRRRQY